MSCCIETTIWCYEYIITKCYFGTVKYYKIVICIEIVTCFYIISVITPEWSCYKIISSHLTEYLLNHCRLLFCL